ncbi:hypothetical protein [Roseivivax sp. CAU 1761]
MSSRPQPRIAAALAAALGLLLAGTAAAQSVCAPRGALAHSLGKHYGERPAAHGLESPHRLMEIFAAPLTGTYTVLLTRSDGISCIVASGQHWQVLTPPRSGESAVLIR